MPTIPFRSLLLFPLAALILGCSPVAFQTPATSSNIVVQGSVHGGQQPISGAQIQLYAVGTTGDGSASTALLAAPALTTANGSFNFTLASPCPSANTLVYLAATGGNPGLATGTNNSAIAALDAIGTCTQLAQAPYLSINEATTVAAVNALAPYLTGPAALGSGSSDSAALASAFTLAAQYTNPYTGRSPGVGLPSGYTAPQAAIYTLADIIAPCINSNGTDGNCATLFGYTNPQNGAPPTDTVKALLNVANYPSINIGNLYSLVVPSSPFQPPLSSAPSSFTLALVPASPTGTVTLSPASLTFNAASVGLAQGTQFLTFTNSTTSAIPAPTFALTGTNKADFTATLSGSACTFTLPPGASCTYSITFVPSATGTRTATFTLTSGSSVFTSALSGTGNTNTDTANLSISGTQAFYSAGTTYDLQLTNSGNTPINFSSIGIGYTRANYQTFTQTNNCAPQLYSQSICTIHLTVSGVRSIGGYSSAYLTLTDDLAPGYQSYPINQYPDQGSYPNYGGWVIGTSSATSLGSSDAYSYPTSSDTTDFKFTYNSCVFAHGFEYCTYNIAFAPATIGPLSDYIAGGDYSTTLTGFGLPAAAYLKANFTSATSVPYGQTTTLGGSVTNYGSTSVTLLTPTFSGPDAAAFTISACGPIANGGCNYTYTFTPTHTGDSYATVTINDSTGTFHVIENIDLVASPSLGSISPSTLSFPNTNIGTTSSAMSATISSAYNLGITASGIGTPFAIVGSSSCASTPCTLSFTYTPNYVGAYSDLVTIKDTNGNTVGTLTLYGTGQTPPVAMAPAVTLSPASFTFGSRPVGSTSIASSGSIMNSGNVTLNLSSVALTGTNAADYILSSSCGSTLAASASCSYNISFAPTASGTRSAAITIVSNAASSPNSVTLTGTAQ